MKNATTTSAPLVETSTFFSGRSSSAGENSLHALVAEAREERHCFLRAIRVALGLAGVGVLAGAALSGVILVLFWEISRVAAMLVLASFYGTIAACLCRQLTLLRRDWQSLPATFDQLTKDCARPERKDIATEESDPACVLPRHSAKTAHLVRTGRPAKKPETGPARLASESWASSVVSSPAGAPPGLDLLNFRKAPRRMCSCL